MNRDHQRICPRCGTSPLADDVRCWNCDYPLPKVGDSTPPATPVERKPTTLELSGTMPDVSHYARCARCGGSGREEDASHPPAVSGEGERMTGRRRCTIREHRRQIKALQRELALLREGRAALWAAKHAAEREADTLRAEVRSLRASTPTPGAPR